MRKLNISEKLGGGRLTTDKPIKIKIGDEIIDSVYPEKESEVDGDYEYE